MRKQRIPARLVCFALTAALLCAAACAFSESWDQLYVANEWNFADGAMDISGGIPENGIVYGAVKVSFPEKYSIKREV